MGCVYFDGNARLAVQHGLIVKLLSPHNAEILAQWHDVLRQNHWAWVDN